MEFLFQCASFLCEKFTFVFVSLIELRGPFSYGLRVLFVYLLFLGVENEE